MACLLTLAFCSKVMADGAGIEWENLNNEIARLSNTAQYESATVVAKKALGIAEKNAGPDHPDVARSLNNLARLYARQGKPEQVEPLLKRALAIREKALGPDHSDVAWILNDLGNMYNKQGKPELAEPLLKRALAIHEKALGNDHPDVVDTLMGLVGVYLKTDRAEEAVPLFKRIKKIKAGDTVRKCRLEIYKCEKGGRLLALSKDLLFHPLGTQPAEGPGSEGGER